MIESLNECLALEKELKLEDNFREHDEWDSMFKLVSSANTPSTGVEKSYVVSS